MTTDMKSKCLTYFQYICATYNRLTTEYYYVLYQKEDNNDIYLLFKSSQGKTKTKLSKSYLLILEGHIEDVKKRTLIWFLPANVNYVMSEDKLGNQETFKTKLLFSLPSHH